VGKLLADSKEFYEFSKFDIDYLASAAMFSKKNAPVANGDVNANPAPPGALRK
jgi:hypothetical protein